MRVLVVIDSLSFGGAENLLAAFGRVAPSLGIDLEVASIAPPTAGRDAWLPVLEAAGLSPRFLSISKLLQRDALARVRTAVRESRCDVVHAHLGTAATLAPLAARLAGRHTVCTFHHIAVPLRGRDLLRERLSLVAATRSRAALFVSQAAKRAFAEQYREDPRTWRVLYNGVDLHDYAPSTAPLPADLGVPPGAPAVTLVGAMRGGKGQDAAIAAWPQVLRAAPEARLLLVGGGAQEADLRAQSQRLGVEHRVVFTGVRTDVPRILAASALAVLPTAREALPTALIEAAGCGVPAVAYSVGGVPEVVEDGVTGRLVRPGDVAGLGCDLAALLVDHDRRRVMGAAARRRAEVLFDIRCWGRTLVSIYERAAAGRPAGAAWQA